LKLETWNLEFGILKNWNLIPSIRE